MFDRIKEIFKSTKESTNTGGLYELNPVKYQFAEDVRNRVHPTVFKCVRSVVNNYGEIFSVGDEVSYKTNHPSGIYEYWKITHFGIGYVDTSEIEAWGDKYQIGSSHPVCNIDLLIKKEE